MSGKSINFEDKQINKSNFYKRESYRTKNSLKYFIGYDDDNLIRPLCIKFPQIIGYVKHFDSSKRISFKVIDNKVLKKYNKIWD